MYNKLFTKILDSSIWLESHHIVRVWFTCIASMDEDGFCQYASVPNLAHRARVTLAEATEAVACLEGPDPHSSDPDHEGRRMERVPGGWIVLNAHKYREMATRIVAMEKTRARVAKHRANKKAGGCNGDVTVGTESSRSSAPSDAVSDADAESKQKKKESPPKAADDPLFARFWEIFPSRRKTKKQDARKAWTSAVKKGIDPEMMIAAAREYAASPLGRSDIACMPSSWLNGQRWDDDRTAWQDDGLDRRKQPAKREIPLLGSE